MNRCPDCGCRMYNGVCTNCHEEIYIAKQYEELDMVMPDSFRDVLGEIEVRQSYYVKREDVKRENKVEQ